ncbi:MAG: amidohydrolase [Pseudomonadales bacterium]
MTMSGVSGGVSMPGMSAMAVCLYLLLGNLALAQAAPDFAAIAERVSENRQQATQLADTLWRSAELGYLETRSTAALQAYLRSAGFSITPELADIPTAFVASAGKGRPVIGILAEFDALPGLSQAAVAQRSPLQEGAPGHACGHHLFGAASASAGAVLAQWLAAERRVGTVKVFGTPAEEGGSGKVYLARAGVFKDVDVMLHWHPGDANDASAYATTANKSGRFTFHGTPAHAAQSPDRGRSALDGVEAMNYMVNMMREHIPTEARIHYVITDGGAAPNIVPERAQAYYYVRHPERDRTAKLFERVVGIAKAAASGTGTKVDVEVMHGNYPVLPNETLAKAVHAHMQTLGGVRYSKEELRFAQTLRETLVGDLRPLDTAAKIAPLQIQQRWGSTDVGDVSWQTPTVGFATATWVPGTPAHTWQAVAAGGMSIGHKGMLLAAQTLALTGAQLFTDAQLLGAARAEFQQRRGAQFRYEALLGDRQPPLDYRK